jgi:hypothetical protein
MLCHPKLEKTIHTDERHKPMLDCIKCHKDNAGSNNACGADCFECHTPEKIMGIGVVEHEVIKTCIKCHVNIKEMKSFEITPEKSANPSLFNLMQESTPQY